jgi:hypothetical protein
VNLVDRRALRELPGQRMLPPAGADDEDSHGGKPNPAHLRLKDPLSTIAP